MKKQLEELQAENSNLKEQVKGTDDLGQRLKNDEQLAANIEKKYQSQIETMAKEMRELQAENSEIKAKQLMNTFQSQGLQGSGTLAGTSDPATSVASSLPTF